jgi:hypothetical protein
MHTECSGLVALIQQEEDDAMPLVTTVAVPQGVLNPEVPIIVEPVE